MASEHRTIVIKIGTSSLTEHDGSMSPAKVREIVRQVAELKRRGDDIVIVSSGAIAAGFRLLGHTQRPKAVAAKQAAAGTPFRSMYALITLPAPASIAALNGGR